MATGNIVQAGTPAFSLTASAASVIGNATTTTLTLISELPCDLSVEGSGASISTPLGTSGVVTTPSGTTITLTMPVNYTTSDVTFTVKASRSGYADESVVITHRKATLRTSQTVTFPCGSGRVYSGSTLTDTRNGITATFEGTLNSTSSTSHIRFASGTQLHFTTNNTIHSITGVSLAFTGNNYRPNGGSATSGGVNIGSLSWATTSTWTYNGTDPVKSLDITMTRNGYTFRLSSFTVTYTDYQWN